MTARVNYFTCCNFSSKFDRLFQNIVSKVLLLENTKNATKIVNKTQAPFADVVLRTVLLPAAVDYLWFGVSGYPESTDHDGRL